MGKRWTSNFCSKWTVVLLIFPKLTPLFSGPIRAELDNHRPNPIDYTTWAAAILLLGYYCMGKEMDILT